MSCRADWNGFLGRIGRDSGTHFLAAPILLITRKHLKQPHRLADETMTTARVEGNDDEQHSSSTDAAVEFETFQRENLCLGLCFVSQTPVVSDRVGTCSALGLRFFSSLSGSMVFP